MIDRVHIGLRNEIKLSCTIVYAISFMYCMVVFMGNRRIVLLLAVMFVNIVVILYSGYFAWIISIIATLVTVLTYHQSPTLGNYSCMPCASP